MDRKCVQCLSTSTTCWHSITDELRNYFPFKELRESTFVCHICYSKCYHKTREVSWRKIQVACTPSIADVPLGIHVN